MQFLPSFIFKNLPLSVLHMFMFQCSYSAPFIFQLNSAIICLRIKILMPLKKKKKKCSPLSPPQDKSVNPKLHTGQPRSLFLIYAVKLDKLTVPCFSPQSDPGSASPWHSHQSHLPPPQFFFVCTQNGGLGPRSCSTSPYFRYTRPPKLYWKINDSPDQMFLFQRQSFRY